MSFHFQNGCRSSLTIILTNCDGLGFGNLLAKYELPSASSFSEEVKNVEIRFLSHNFMANTGAPPIPRMHNPGT